MIKGIDVARYQDTNPDPASLPGVSFYIAKASQGLTKDPTYNAHIANARKEQIPIIGAYHFSDNRILVSKQVEFFLQSAGDVDIYALDVEGQFAFSDSQCKDFINRMHLAGKDCGVYGSESGYPIVGQDWRWVANYSREPHIQYDIWQYGPFVPGVDGNKYNGTVSQLMEFFNMASVQAAVTDEVTKLVTTGPNSTWYDLDGKTAVITGRPALPQRYSPYGVGSMRAIFATVDAKRRIVLIKPASVDNLPVENCADEVAAAIQADRAKAHIAIEY